MYTVLNFNDFYKTVIYRFEIDNIFPTRKMKKTFMVFWICDHSS